MGYGLGANSPVVLNLGKENYESLLIRHGTWIRWAKGVKCPCTQKDTEQPDPRCPRCSGKGVFYSYQKNMIVTQTLPTDDSGVIEVLEEYENAVLDTVYDYDGKKYAAVKHGVYISLKEAPPEKSTYLYVVMIMDTARRLETAGCENIGGGYYRVNGIASRRAGIDGLFHTAPGDIQKIEKIVDAKGNVWEHGEFRTDMFTLKPPPPPAEDKEPLILTEPLTAVGVEYIPPYLFAMLSQNLSKADEKEVVESKGDAICTFPYNCDVSDDDVLTVLAGTYTQKEVVNRVNAEHDVIGAYFVMDISSCVGVDREYRKGADYLLAGTNRIKWLCADAPAPGEAYSITYQVCPSYKVIKTIPQVRTAENQRLPKKVVVKLFTQYNEMQGINRQ